MVGIEPGSNLPENVVIARKSWSDVRKFTEKETRLWFLVPITG